MEASALKYAGSIGLHGRSPLLRLQSDERLITLVRRGNLGAFEVLVARYHARLLSFCRHLLGSREDAEDVLQEVMTAAFNAMIADDRPINVRPWLYRIARNRCLNHLRRVQAVGVDSMDIHLSDSGETTADKVHKAEEFRLLVTDIQALPETQRTALVLREMDALSYEQISEAMETTVPSVKSLLVRARMSLAEAAEARLLTCEQVRMELAEVAEGLLTKTTPPVRRHMRTCERCSRFQSELKRTSRALAALLPLGPMALLKTLALTHLGHSASAGASSGASAGTGAAAGTSAAVGSSAAAGGALVGAGGMMPIGLGAVGVKAAAGLAAAALVTAGAVDLSHNTPVGHHHLHPALTQALSSTPDSTPYAAAPAGVTHHLSGQTVARHARHHRAAAAQNAANTAATKATPVKQTLHPDKNGKAASATTPGKPKSTKVPGTAQSESIATVMSSGSNTSSGSSGASGSPPAADGSQTSTASTSTQPGSGTPTSGNTGVPLGNSTPPSGSGSGTGTGSDPGTGSSGTGSGSGTTSPTADPTGTPVPTPDPGTTPAPTGTPLPVPTVPAPTVAPDPTGSTSPDTPPPAS